MCVGFFGELDVCAFFSACAQVSPLEDHSWTQQKEHVCMAWGEMGMELTSENSSTVGAESHLWAAVVFEWLIKLHLSLLIG